jgi:PTS system nitrogen regulatory IIA component
MDVATILDPASVGCHAEVAGKKHALELLSEMLAAASGRIRAGSIMDALTDRERMGSTGLGSAVAMPHARMAEVESMVGAVLCLGRAVDFESSDGVPVDLLFGLLVPRHCSAGELDEIRELVAKLRDPQLQAQLHSSKDPAVLYRLLTDGLAVGKRAAPPNPPVQPQP